MSSKKAWGTKLIENEIDFDAYMRETSIEKQNITNLLQRKPSNVTDSRTTTNTSKVIALSGNERDELIDQSMIFEEAFICQYWASNDEERKGKLLISKSELLFKRSRMSVVNMRTKLSDIESVTLFKNYKNQKKTVLLITCQRGHTYAFHKFRTSRHIVQKIIMRYVEKCTAALDKSESNTDLISSSQTWKNGKLYQKISNVKEIYKSPLSSSSMVISEEGNDDSETSDSVISVESYKPQYRRNSDSEIKSNQSKKLSDQRRSYSPKPIRMSAIKRRFTKRRLSFGIGSIDLSVNEDESNTTPISDNEISDKTTTLLETNKVECKRYSKIKIPRLITNLKQRKSKAESPSYQESHPLLMSNTPSDDDEDSDYLTADEYEETTSDYDDDDDDDDCNTSAGQVCFRNELERPTSLDVTSVYKGGKRTSSLPIFLDTKIISKSFKSWYMKGTSTEMLISISLVLFACFFFMSLYNLLFLKYLESSLFEIYEFEKLLAQYEVLTASSM